METGFKSQIQLSQPGIWVKRIIFVGKAFILIAVLFLAYLLWNVRAGYMAGPEEKYLIGQKVLPFSIIAGYSISFASNGLFSKIVVLDNSSTQQRIVLNRVYFRKERKPPGFELKFNHPHQNIHLRKSTFTGLENPYIMKYGITEDKYQKIPYVIVESNTAQGVKKGAIFCLYCPTTGKSFFIESAAPFNRFSETDIFDFVKTLGSCH